MGDCGACRKKNVKGETREHTWDFICNECLDIADRLNALDNVSFIKWKLTQREMEEMRTWQTVLEESDEVKNDTKLLKLDQDYLLLSLNEAIEAKDEKEKSKLCTELRAIQYQLDRNDIRLDEIKSEYEAIKSINKPKQRW